MSTYDPFEQQRRVLRMLRPFESVSKAMRFHEQATRVTPSVSDVWRLQDRATGMTHAIATDGARGMSPTMDQNDVARRAARAMADHGLQRVRRAEDVGISASRHHGLRSMRATAALADSNSVASILDRTRRAPRWWVSSRASRALGEPYGARAIFDAASAGRSAYAQREHHKRPAISSEVARVVQDASAVLRDVQRLPSAHTSLTTDLVAPGGLSLLSVWDRARLALAEQELQRVAMVTALDVGWSRQVERALATVRGALRDDAATPHAASVLARLPSAILPGRGLGMSQSVPVIGFRLPTIARVADLQEVVTRSLEIADRGSLVIVVFDELRESLDGSPLRFLTSVLDLDTAVVLMRVETARGREAVLDAIASAVVDSDVLRAVEDGLDGLSAKLSPMNRRRLRGVLAKLSEEPTDWLAISDSLILGVEAAFRSGAETDGLTARRPVRGKNTQYLMVGAQPRQLSGIEMLFEHVGLDDERVAFLKRLAFGGPGNVFRHGGPGHGDENEGDYRRHAVAMVLAFVLWFEAHGDRRPLDALASAVEVRRYSLRRPLVPSAE